LRAMLLKSKNKFEIDQRQRYDGAAQPLPAVLTLCLRAESLKETPKHGQAYETHHRCQQNQFLGLCHLG
jgi:hypothetical protein